MRKAKSPVSKRIVVDTCVARSAGTTTSPSDLSRNCRHLMEAMLDICHKVVMTKDIEAEWIKHASRFSRTWLTRMVSKGKRIYAEPYKERDLYIRIKDISQNDGERAAMEKDIHLLEAALSTDGIIISIEERVRRHFCRLCVVHTRINDVHWVNPESNDYPILYSWLLDGAPNKVEWTFWFMSDHNP